MKCKCERFVFQTFRKTYFYVVSVFYAFYFAVPIKQSDFAGRYVSCPFDSVRKFFSFRQCIDGVKGFAVFVGGEPDVSIVVNRGVRVL